MQGPLSSAHPEMGQSLFPLCGAVGSPASPAMLLPGEDPGSLIQVL